MISGTIKLVDGTKATYNIELIPRGGGKNCLVVGPVFLHLSVAIDDTTTALYNAAGGWLKSPEDNATKAAVAMIKTWFGVNP